MLYILRKNKVYFISLFVFWIVTALFLSLSGKDESFLLLIPKQRTNWMDYFFNRITFIGDGLSFAMLLLVMLFFSYRYFLSGALIFALSSLLSYVIKQFYHAPRPLKYFSEQQINLHLPADTIVHMEMSYPSGHTTTAFAMFTFLACITNNKAISFLLFILALLAGYSRVYLCQHFPEDVLAGSILGFITAILIGYLIQKIPADKLQGKLSIKQNNY